MGIFGKIFGGSGGENPNDPAARTPAQPDAVPPAADAPAGAVPARRERSKPKAAPHDTPVDGASASEGETENVALIQAIHAVVAGDSSETRKQLYEAILAAQVYLVVMGDTTDFSGSESGEVQLDQGQQVSLATIRDPNGVTYLPAFTDVERMSRTLPDDARYLRVPATVACRMFLQGTGQGIVINPGQAPSGVITRPEAELLAQGTLPEVGEGGSLMGAPPQQMRIAIGKLPEPANESFVEALRTAAAGQPSVREVHLFIAGIQDQPPRRMIGLVIDDGVTPEQMHPTFDAIGKAAFAARASEDEHFDMMPLSPDLLEAIRPLEGNVYTRA